MIINLIYIESRRYDERKALIARHPAGVRVLWPEDLRISGRRQKTPYLAVRGSALMPGKCSGVRLPGATTQKAHP